MVDTTDETPTLTHVRFGLQALISDLSSHIGYPLHIELANSQANVTKDVATKTYELTTKDIVCPDGKIAVNDVLHPKSMTHEGRKIPRVIHIIVRSKCLPLEIIENVQQWANLHAKHTVLFHDQKEIDEFLSNDRIDLPHIPNAAKCAVEPLAKLDLAR